ncbi:hypothetical protein GCM10022393_32360 [Aquimarina addita]|uniref:histidine kinase n=1 Tax=Aquimarina addita TaxID=870485 RepID=A0ABP6USW4_9FLAO
MQIKIPALFLLLLLVLGAFSCSKSTDLTKEEKEWLQQNDSITVAVFPYYIPYQFINNSKNIDGIFIEYLDLIEEKTNYTFQKKYYTDWTQLLEDVKRNEVDIILEIQESDNKKSFLTFYPPLFESDQVIVTKKEASFGITINSLHHKRLVLPKNYAITENLENQYPALNITTEDDDITCLKKVADGTYDAYIGPRAVVNFMIRNQRLDNLVVKGKTHYTYKPGLAVRKNNPILNNIIDKTFHKITKEEKETILNNWYYNTITPYYRTPKFWITFSVLLLFIVLLIASLNYYLKYKIKQRTEDLLIAKEIADESNRLKTNFINNIPYEIRTPMNSVIGLSKLLDHKELSIKERKRIADLIIGNSKLLISIIDNILEISLLQTKRITLKPSEFWLNTFLQDLHSIYKIKAEEKHISFTIKNHVSEYQNLLFIDKYKLLKILTNLIDNAIQFTNQGHVTVSCALQNKKLIFLIKDTGIGMNQVSQNTIRKSLTKIKNNSNKHLKGFGFGLTIAKRNIDYLEGFITFTSKKNEGTTFSVEIPYHQTINSKRDANDNDQKRCVADTIEKQVILIVEDNNVNYFFLKTLLTKMEGFDFIIYRAANGKEAISICRNHNTIDLVLMDIKMPIMDGYEATKHIKKLRPSLPIIAQTAFSAEEDIQKAFSAGCDDFISKPIDQKRLKLLMRKYFLKFKRKERIKNTMNR